MKKLFLILALAGSMASCSSTKPAAKSEADEKTQQTVQQMLDKKMYKMDFDMGYPMGGRSFPLNYPYFVSVTGDRVESFLPYFGRAYTVPYGGGEGLNFNGQISGYTMKEGKKGQKLISFTTRTDEDEYTFNIEVYLSGSAYLNINAVNKQGMSFSGNVDLSPEFDAVKAPAK